MRASERASERTNERTNERMNERGKERSMINVLGRSSEYLRWNRKRLSLCSRWSYGHTKMTLGRDLWRTSTAAQSSSRVHASPSRSIIFATKVHTSPCGPMRFNSSMSSLGISSGVRFGYNAATPFVLGESIASRPELGRSRAGNQRPILNHAWAWACDNVETDRERDRERGRKSERDE